MAAPDRHSDSFGDADDDALADAFGEPPLDEPLDEDDRGEPPLTRVAASRLFRVFTALLDVHLATARAEVRRDQARIVRGLFLMILGATLLVTVALLLQVVGVSLLMRQGFSLLSAVLLTAGADGVLGAVLIALGARALRRPVLPSTRALLKRTVSSLRS
ncbi:MAG: phage holin family protein [Polyangia bacterium]